MRTALALALLAAFPAPACANEEKREALCAINGREAACSLDISMSQGGVGVIVTTRDGRSFTIKNAVPRGARATIADLTWDKEVWTVNGRGAKYTTVDPGLWCFQTRRVRVCAPL
jgi:hypothetical protein